MNHEEVVERLNKLEITTPIVFADKIDCSVDSLNDSEVFQKASEEQPKKWFVLKMNTFSGKIPYCSFSIRASLKRDAKMISCVWGICISITSNSAGQTE